MNRLFLLIFAALMPMYGADPVIFYTDLVSGPKTGGENNKGVFVSIFGKNFGTSKGSSTVTVGGVEVATYKSWCATCDRAGLRDMIVVQLGPTTPLGSALPVVVTVNGVASNADATFTVRNGNIFCVSNSGNNSNDGKFPSEPGTGHGCWQTARYAIDTIGKRGGTVAAVAGDTIYLGSSSSDNFTGETGADPCHGTGYGGLQFSPACVNSGTKTSPIALVGYPGATATIGASDASHEGTGIAFIQLYGTGGFWWTLSNIVVIGGTAQTDAAAISASAAHGGRLVNLDLSAHTCTSKGKGAYFGKTQAVEGEGTIAWLLGNYFHDLSNASQSPRSDKSNYHLYITTDGNEIEVAWNYFKGNVGMSRGISIHSSPEASGGTDGQHQWGLLIHDNMFQGLPGPGIDLATMNPYKGSGIKLYNNIFDNVGNCVGWQDSGSAYPALWMGAGNDYRWSPYTPDENNPLKVYNNTFYNVGACQIDFGSANGVIWPHDGNSWSSPNTWGGFTGTAPPQVFQNIASGCSGATCTGTIALDPTSAYTRFYPGFIAFVAYYAGSTDLGLIDDWRSAFKCTGLTPDLNGASTCTHFIRQDSTSDTVSTFNYNTGAFSITWPSAPAAGSRIAYIYNNAYEVKFTNNIVYLKSNQEFFAYYSANPQLFGVGRLKYNGSNNVFYRETTPLKPWMLFTGSVTSDPLFTDKTTDNFRLQSLSPAKNTGVNTNPPVTRDFDGALRPASGKFSMGAFESGGATPPPTSACDVNGDTRTDVLDVQSTSAQVIGLLPCSTGDINKDGKCDNFDVQLIIQAVLSGTCPIVP
jgi:hypothetical protein